MVATLAPLSGDPAADVAEPPVRAEPAPPLRTGFVTAGDPRDPRFWSGTPYNMAAALEAHGAEITRLGPLSASLLTPFKVYARLREKAGLGRPSPFHAMPVARQYAADMARKIEAAAPDVVFAPAGSAYAWNVPKGIPLAYASDATSERVIGYHPHYRDLPAGARRTIHELEQRTIDRADLLLYPSEWAARSAIDDFGADPARVAVVPWGANLADPPTRAEALAERKPGPCRLLFAGVSWFAKGADIAIEALRILRASGVEAELVIVGTTPPQPIEEPGLTIVPFLNKRDARDRATLDRLYRDADIFILPTRGDCYGIAFCEAAAYGVPSIAPATGGVPGAVADGETGFLVGEDARGEAYAEAIAALYGDPAAFGQMRISARNAFETRLNWDAWAKTAIARMSALG